MRSTRSRLVAGAIVLVAAVALAPLLSAQSGETVESADQVWAVAPDGQELHKVSPREKWQRDVTWSPDGRALAFTSKVGGRTVIEIASPDGGPLERIRINKRLGTPSAVAWSPRGKELAFAAVREFRIDIRQTIARIRLDGSGLRRLASYPYGAVVDSGPVWSPDGRRIAYVRQRKWRPHGKPVPPVVPTTEALDLVVSSRGGRRRVIGLRGADVDPRWSPDGGRIAFQHQAGRSRYELRTVSPAGRHMRTLGPALVGPRFHAWAPDGRSLALTAIGADRRPHLVIVGRGGRARPVPVSGLVAQLRPAWSPDGKLLAFADYDGHLNVVAPDGTGQRTVATLAGADFFELSWSPDGRWIAFVAAKHVASD